MLAPACTSPELYADGKYRCDAQADCAEGFVCLDGRCRDGFPHAAAACGECVDGACAPELAACSEDPACAQLYLCMATCVVDDVACRRACEADAPTAAESDVFTALDGCRRAACLDSCVGVGGFFGLLGDACGACVRQACLPELAACVGPSPAEEGVGPASCERLEWCVRGERAPSPVSWTSCSAILPTPQSQADLHDCFRDRCHDECHDGAEWRCVGDYEWLAPETFAFSQRVRLFDSYGAGAVAGARVRAYEPCLNAERQPSEGWLTDATGVAELELDGSVGFQGCLHVEAEGYFPTELRSTRPYTGRGTTNWGLVPANLVSVFEELLQMTYDPEAGVVIVSAQDCLSVPASNAEVSLTAFDGSTQQVFYNVDGYPARDPGGATDGQAFLVNVPPGLATLTLRDASGALLSDLTLQVRAGWVHSLDLWPHSTSQAP